jgi:phage terminase large subunit
MSMSAQDLAIAEAMERPSMFSDVMLGHDMWSKQRLIQHSVATNRETAVKACHSSGKTFLAADVALWWLARYEESIVVTTAPTDTQVRKLLWGEISSTVQKSPYRFPAPNQTELWINPKRYAIGFSTNVTAQNQGVRFQGFHSPHILVIVDEAPGVHPGIWDAIRGIMAGGHVAVLYLGNPTINSGPFYDCFTKNRADVSTFTISAFDTPNLSGLTIEDLLRMEQECPAELDDNPRPYLTTRRWVLDRYKEWGSDHQLYQSRVLGQFPTQSSDSLISLAWLERAKLDESAPGPDEEICAGLDVAGPGEDETVLCVRQGRRVLSVEAWPKEDPRGEVIAKLKPYEARITRFAVDSIGLGWGIYLHMRDHFGRCVVPVNVGEGTVDNEKYLNLKAELYWGLRLQLQAGGMAGLTDEKAIGQLAGIRYGTNSRGQLFIEKKSDAVKRGVKSPDRAEAIMLAYCRLRTNVIYCEVA